MTKKIFLINDDKSKGEKVYQEFKEEEENIADEILETAEREDLPFRKLTLFTNDTKKK